MKDWDTGDWFAFMIAFFIGAGIICGVCFAVWSGALTRTEQSDCRKRGGDVVFDEHRDWRCVGAGVERAR